MCIVQCIGFISKMTGFIFFHFRTDEFTTAKDSRSVRETLGATAEYSAPDEVDLRSGSADGYHGYRQTEFPEFSAVQLATEDHPLQRQQCRF